MPILHDNKKINERIYSVCVHEASHALVTLHYGLTVTKINVLEWGGNPHYFCGQCSYKGELPNEVDTDFYLAGLVGQRVFALEILDGDGLNDMNRVAQLRGIDNISVDDSSLEMSYNRVEGLVRKYKNEIQTLANFLMGKVNISLYKDAPETSFLEVASINEQEIESWLSLIK